MKTEKERLHFSAKVAGIDFEAAELRITALLIAQLNRFEQAYSLEAGIPVADIAKWRLYDQTGYKPIASPILQGAWAGWQMCERLSGNDPFMGFILEGANAGELAAYDYAFFGLMGALSEVLDDMEGSRLGVGNAPWQCLRERLWKLMDEAKSNKGKDNL